jgi:hypothetical protein
MHGEGWRGRGQRARLFPPHPTAYALFLRPPRPLQGLLASWGASEFGQLGQGGEGVDQPQPRVVKAARDVKFARWVGGGRENKLFRSAVARNILLDAKAM